MQTTKIVAKAVAFAAALALTHTAGAASADYVYVAPTWAHGAAGTSYAAWDVFGGTTDSTPDIGSSNITSAVVKELTGAAFLTGGGNIYSFAAPTYFNVAIDSNANGPVTGGLITATLQLFTLGTGLDTSSVLLNGVAGSGGVYKQFSAGTVMGGEAFNTHYLFTWTVAATDVLNFTFNAAGSSMSLDTVAVDVSQVPVPAAAWLFGSAVMGLAGVSRRRKTQH